MEFVKVTYPEERGVDIDGAPQGRTNELVGVQRGHHIFDLGEPFDYDPPSRTVVVAGTTQTRPLIVEFQPAFAGVESDVEPGKTRRRGRRSTTKGGRATTATPVRSGSTVKRAALEGVKARFSTDPQHGTPRLIFDIESKPERGGARTIAERFLKKIARDLEIDPNLSQLKFDKIKPTIFGSQVLYQQYHNGHPISGAWIKVDINRQGKVFNVVNDLVPRQPLTVGARKTAREAPVLPAVQAAAVARALAHKKGGTTEILEPELVYFPHDGVPTLAWKVIVLVSATEATRSKRAEWKFYLDAHTGNLLAKIDLLKRIEGRGQVFDPNPVVALNDATLEDRSKVPAAAYVQVKLSGLRNRTGVLDGEFVSTRRTIRRVKRPRLSFVFTRGQRPFKEVMVYFHIDRVQRYIQSLGFDNVMNHPIEVNIDGERDDNSHYSAATRSLTFGTGGVDDAEDADIILHEYGHAVQDDQVPGWGERHEGGAMGEGFGDYLAASFFSNAKPAKMKPTVGNWDAVAYSDDDPPCLRRLDSNKKYPKDLTREVHDDGEIWSACLWEIRAALGRKTTDRLVIAHHFLLSRFAEFKDGALALISADHELHGGAHEALIRDVFTRRGILVNPAKKGRRAGLPFERQTPPRTT